MHCFKKQPEEMHCQVSLLDGKMLNVNIQGDAKGSDLLQKVFDQLNLLETDCFGLRYKDKDNAAQWVDPNKSLKRQIKNVSDMTLYFGVKFYLENPCQLREEITRYQFFLQLKHDVLVGRIPCETGMATVLASLCVQSDLGDFDVSRHTDGYISEFRFIPDQSQDFEQHVAELHQSLRGMSFTRAEAKFLEKVQRLEMYGVDLHMVTRHDGIIYYLGLTPTGIRIYHNKTSIAHYFWPNISRVHFEERKFILAVQRRSGGDNEYSFQLDSNEACKRLWTCCVEQHAFFRLPSFISTSVRNSGRTKKEVLQLSSSLRRKQPRVERTPSKRFSRRFSSECEVDAVIFRESQAVNGGNDVTKYECESSASAVSTRSLPWADVNHSQGGLYSPPSKDIYDSHRSRKRKPLSRGASSPGFSRRYHSDRSGDESESDFSRRYRRNMSLTDLTDNKEVVVRRRRRRKSRGGDTSGSEAENDYRRKRSHSSDKGSSLYGRDCTAYTSTPDHIPFDMKRSPANMELSRHQSVDGMQPPQNGDINPRSAFRSGRIGQGHIAMQELEQELVKLGQPSVNKRQLPRIQGKEDQDKDIPFEVLSNGSMYLTTQEIVQVSQSLGKHHDLLTEL